jgi:hypothetical protein
VGIDAAEKHYYLMTGVQAGRLVRKNHRLSQFISQDLPIFSTVEENFFVTRVDANKGIQCRFGMKGVIAEAHYDGGRNMVHKRAPCKECVPWICFNHLFPSAFSFWSSRSCSLVCSRSLAPRWQC